MTDSEEKIVAHAIEILSNNLRKHGDVLTAPSVVKRYLTLRLADLEREIFGVLLLNAKNELTATEDLFLGTLLQTTVHPREIVKKVLHHNAASVICYHNHPSCSPKPSEADRRLTTTLQQTLELIDVRLLDHIVVGGLQTYSFAEHGDL